MLEVQLLSTIEVEEGGLVEVLVASLHEVALCIQIGILRLVKLGDGGLAVLVLRLRQYEGILAGICSCLAAGVLAVGSNGIVVGLLYLLIE